MRNPSIHINKSNFVEALKKCGLSFNREKIDSIFTECYKHRITDRYLISTNKKAVAEKLLNLHRHSNSNIDLFHKLLNYVRNKRGHKYISRITSNSSSYNLLKEVSTIADDFCDVFNLNPNEGYVDFCSIGLDLMGNNYQLTKFKFLSEKIFNVYEWVKLILDDPTKEFTEGVILYYETLLASKGVDFKVTTLEERIHFYYAKNEVIEHNTTPKKWIDSQFAELEFLDVYPNPNQLYGPNSLKRYKNYLISHPDKKVTKIDDGYDYDAFFREKKKK